MMKSIIGLKTGIEKKESDIMIARKLFLSYSTEVFKENEDAEFYIKNSIADRFNIRFSSIEIVGSSKIGLSLIKCKKFEPRISDLDIAIINLYMFNKFSEEAHKLTKGYTDLSVFPRTKNPNGVKIFRSGISIDGFVNPYYMPNCQLRSEWLDFFNKLSNGYYHLFRNINAGIYASEYFFESKQGKSFINYHGDPEEYDKISS